MVVCRPFAPVQEFPKKGHRGQILLHYHRDRDYFLQIETNSENVRDSKKLQASRNLITICNITNMTFAFNS